MRAVGLQLGRLRLQASARIVGVRARAVSRADAAKSGLREQLPQQRGLERVLPERTAFNRFLFEQWLIFLGCVLGRESKLFFFVLAFELRVILRSNDLRSSFETSFSLLQSLD